MQQVPVRSLRNETAKVLDRVKNGEVVEVTHYGRPIARIVPLTLDRWDQLKALGEIEASTEAGDVLDIDPVESTPDVPPPSEVLARLRADER